MSNEQQDKPVKISLEKIKSQDKIEVTPINPLQLVEENEQQEAAQIVFKEQTKGGIKRLFWPAFSTLVIGAATFQTYQFIQELFLTNAMLGMAGIVVAGAALVSGGVALFNGWRARRRLANRQSAQQEFKRILQQDSYGKAGHSLQELTQEISEYVEISVLEKKYQSAKQQVHNDHELIQIYSNSVLAGLDKMALDIISKHASEAAVMVALSPLAIADMALVAWRSSKMIQELSRLYGCPQTAFGRIDMTKQVFKNMMLAGASELVAEAGVEMLGKTLTASVSTKVAQGIGIGVLISRMGIQTMSLCRPIEFTEQNKPRLSHLRKAIYNKVVGIVKNTDRDKNEERVKSPIIDDITQND
ncbi:MAG: TIGR01620 family protein [Kangiellaceae bacterium]|nr:TIGR01620 family protein [Kangiellaceae bacterium]